MRASVCVMWHIKLSIAISINKIEQQTPPRCVFSIGGTCSGLAPGALGGTPADVGTLLHSSTTFRLQDKFWEAVETVIWHLENNEILSESSWRTFTNFFFVITCGDGLTTGSVGHKLNTWSRKVF